MVLVLCWPLFTILATSKKKKTFAQHENKKDTKSDNHTEGDTEPYSVV